jgi:hypothetical protein
MKKLSLIFLSVSLALSLGYLHSVYATTIMTTDTVPIISTRGHFNQFAEQIPQNESYNLINFKVNCPVELVIYVHGVWTNEDASDSTPALENAKEVFDRLKGSLNDVGYKFPIVGFSWDSDTDITPNGWENAKIIAKENGAKLSKFLLDIKNSCKTQNKDVNLRLIGHSLGARLILSTLDNLNNNKEWNNKNYTIKSINLLGAAIDNNEISKNINDIKNIDSIKSAYGTDIEEEVLTFYNLYNSEDDVLEPFDLTEWPQPIYYPFFENNLALGQKGAALNIDKPNNYIDIPVTEKISFRDDADGDGGCDLLIPFTFYCTIKREGDNHFGYIGFRDSSNGGIVDNGVVGLMVDKWNISQ